MGVIRASIVTIFDVSPWFLKQEFLRPLEFWNDSHVFFVLMK